MPTFQAEVHNGRAHLYNRVAYDAFITQMEGKRITVEVEKWSPRHSDNQRKFYFGVVLKALERANIGYFKDEFHQICKDRFLAVEKNGRTFARSTTTLSTAEFSDYLERVIVWAATEFGVVIDDA